MLQKEKSRKKVRRKAGGEQEKNVIQIQAVGQSKRKVRVAVYCRVSTEHESQISSVRAQQKHYELLLKEHDDWELVGIYAEAGVSGTKLEGRAELDRLLEDARHGLVDMILTKSISRFARNTAECLTMIRELNACGTSVCFEKENLDTSSMEGELILTILSSLAEDESRSISENSKWAVRKRFERGIYRFSNAPYGYDLADGNYRINEAEAAVVRHIYERVLEGVGAELIARELNEAGVPTKQGSTGKREAKWHSGTIKSILHNVAYTGDILMQKTYRDASFKNRFNYGEVQRYYMDGHHEGIISPEVFELAQAAILQRGKEKGVKRGDGNSIPERSGQHCFSGKLRCGYCGGNLKRITTDRKAGKQYKWCCVLHHKDASACALGRVGEKELENAFCTMMNKLSYSLPGLLEPYMRAAEARAEAGVRDETEEIRKRLSEIEARKKETAGLLNAGCLDMAEYRTGLIALEAEKRILEEKYAQILANSRNGAEYLSDLTAAAGMWREILADSGGFPDVYFRLLTDHAEITDREFTFFLKCGLHFSEMRE